jgi:CRISPR/Cas system CSM-associated protein Csm4 (group 5 of RAMP superfamily)
MFWQWFSKVENKVQNGFFQIKESLETPYPENVFDRPNKNNRMKTKKEKKNSSKPL